MQEALVNIQRDCYTFTHLVGVVQNFACSDLAAQSELDLPLPYSPASWLQEGAHQVLLLFPAKMRRH